MQLDHFGMYPERAFMKVAGRITLEGGGGKGGSAPPPPDYTGAAQATAQGNKEAAMASQAGNMINQYTPQGSVTYAQRGESNGVPLWEQVVSLSPEQRAAYDKDVAMNSRLQDVGMQGVGYVQNALNAPLQSPGQAVGSAGTTQFQTNVPEQQLQKYFANNAGQIRTNVQDPNLVNQQVTDALYKQQTQYLDPQFERSGKALENQLANQGITRGSEAWNNAMQESNAQKQQAYESARTQAIGQGTQAASQMYQNQLAGMGATNQALGQQFGQGMSAQQAANQAMLSQFGMGMSNADLVNQVANQRYGQQLSNAQLQNQALQQNFGNAQTLRQEPINILNAVRTGSQMQSAAQPQVGVSSPGQLATWSGPDLLGAATAQGQYNQGLYNSQNAASSNQMSGLMGLAGTAAMAGGMAF